MKKMDRRDFIKTGLSGIAGLTILPAGITLTSSKCSSDKLIDMVKLGKSGLTVPRLAMGTGTRGYNRSSNQTRQGMEAFLSLARHAYERGARFYDMADGYGSMPFVAEAIKTLPREKITLLSKLWTSDYNAENPDNVEGHIDRFRKELGVDQIEILLLHCMQRGNWNTTRKHYMDSFSKAKQAGIIKAVGISSHNKEALAEAAVNPWVDVIMARINPFGTNMDGQPDEITKILATAKANGKGIIGMKIFGEGKHVQDDEREKSIRFAFKEGCVNCVTLGLESIAQMDDAIEKLMSLKA